MLLTQSRGITERNTKKKKKKRERAPHKNLYLVKPRARRIQSTSRKRTGAARGGFNLWHQSTLTKKGAQSRVCLPAGGEPRENPPRPRQ